MLESAPALAESIEIRERPRGWELASSKAERAVAEAMALADAIESWTSALRDSPLFRSMLATAGGGGGWSDAGGLGGFSSTPPSPPGFGATPPSGGTPALTASASGVPLVAGWNLVSLPAAPADPSPPAVFASLGAALVRVWSYDLCDAGDPWKVYDPANPGESDLTSISVTTGLWIEVNAPAVLATSGSEPPLSTTLRLCAGWNQVGFPSSSPRTVSNALATIAGKYLRVFGYDAEDGAASRAWKVSDPTTPAWASSLGTMQPGKGFWILATEATDLTISNVGQDLVASFSAPTDLAEVTGPVAIAGLASGSSLASWTLTVRSLEEGEPRLLASGTSPVSGTLAALDPTLLLNGLHELELSALDTEGAGISATRTVEVEGQRKIGVFTVSFVDVELPISGLPIQLVRSYDTRRKDVVGDFGHGWTLDIRAGSYRTNGPAGTSWRISPGFLPCQTPVEGRGHRATIRLSDQEVYRFRAKLSSLAPTLGGCFLRFGWEQVDGPEPGASLEVIGDNELFWANGAVDLVYADSQELFDPKQARLTTRDGRRFEIDRTSGVTRLEDANANSVTITPGAIVHSLGRTITIERDAQGRIERLVDPAGEETTFGYDAAGDLVATTNAEEETTTFRYQGHALYEAKDPRGVVVLTNVYGPNGRLAEAKDAFGRSISFDHRLADNVEIVTNRLGKHRLFEYDARGNVIREVDELGNETSRTFFDDGLPLTETNAEGETTRYAYDPLHKNLLSVTDPLGNVTRFTYNSRGDVLTTTDPRGKVTTNVYDTKGNLIKSTDPLGHVTRYAYDTRGRLLTETDAAGKVSTTAYSTTEPWNGPAFTVDPLGHRTDYAYNLAGDVHSESTSWTDETGAVRTLVTGYRYRVGHRHFKTIAPDGTETETEYYPNGQVKATIDALDRRTELTYDAAGQPRRTTYPDGTFEESDYDAEGRRTSSRDRAGRITTYVYDDAGRLKLTIAPGGATTEQVYDDAGRVIESIDARRKSTHFEYDAAGRRTKVRDHLGHETVFGYDAAGNQTSVRDAKGNTTIFVYDDAGRLTRTNFPDTTFTTTVYDALGRRTSETDQAGKVTQFGYDALGRLTSVTDARNQVTRYGYDELGNRTSQTDANGRITTFGYDELGRQTKRTLPAVAGVAASERFEYDAVGNRKKRFDFLDRLTTYTYEPLTSRLSRRDYPDGSFHAFTYTPTGRRETMVDARGTTSYGYDERDRLTSLLYPDGRELGYGYDANGNRTSLTALVGGQTLATTYTYDDLSRLETVTDPAGKVYVHAYDDNGNRRSLDFPNGVRTDYTYDALNRLESLTTISGATGQTVVSFAYTLGAAGNRTKIVEHDGTTRDYVYDDLYRLTEEHVTLAGATRWRNGFTYDAVGNRQRQDRIETTGSLKVVNYGYDERDRLLSENSGDVTAYGWDENGNQISKSGFQGATYEWDFENRLKKVTLVNGTVVEHAYDPDGTRVRTTTTPSGGPAEVVDYLVDTLGLSQVVAESSAVGVVTALHVRGDDLLATLRPDAESWTARYFHAEGIGSIRALTDEVGAVSDRYEFEAFGTLVTHSGSDRNAFLFAGEAIDALSGLYYNRSRWSAPGFGRFSSMDLFGGLGFEPLSLHRYLYANASPVDWADPTGLFSGAELSIVTGIQEIVTSIQIDVAINVLTSQGFDESGNLSKALMLASLATGGIALLRNWKAFASAFKQVGRGFGGTARLFFKRLHTWARRGHMTWPTGIPQTEGLALAGDLRRALNLKSMERNIAVAEISVNGRKDLRFSVSGNSSPFGTAPVPMERRFVTRRSGRPTENHSEVKILEQLAEELSPNSSGVVSLYTERQPCFSCSTLDEIDPGVIEQFEAAFPQIKVHVTYSYPGN